MKSTLHTIKDAVCMCAIERKESRVRRIERATEVRGALTIIL